MSTIDYSIMPFALEARRPPTFEEALSTYKLEQTVVVPPSVSDAVSNITEITVGLTELRLPNGFNYDITITHRGKTVTLFEAYDGGVDGVSAVPDLASLVGWGPSPYTSSPANGTVAARCTEMCQSLPLCVNSYPYEGATQETQTMHFVSLIYCGSVTRPDPMGCLLRNSLVPSDPRTHPCARCCGWLIGCAHTHLLIRQLACAGGTPEPGAVPDKSLQGKLQWGRL